MPQNTKKTSPSIATLASEVLQGANSSKTARSLAASALAQANTQKQTGSELEETAYRVLQSSKYNETTKQLAASVLSQSNKSR